MKSVWSSMFQKCKNVLRWSLRCLGQQQQVHAPGLAPEDPVPRGKFDGKTPHRTGIVEDNSHIDTILQQYIDRLKLAKLSVWFSRDLDVEWLETQGLLKACVDRQSSIFAEPLFKSKNDCRCR
ncbi:GL14606 [Drosophila persimilis]|uniref:GL14606 n=1 Tax=Drosophila persimilis TaxID=7234 RepID=B4GVT3_DROPE|nr:GL14606 [Drosophila persimilis]